ncbi:lipid IV(A) 3-deoxy-D-manno-octulosonic acid transferase [Thalassotalea sp. G2M2-11]|uniref:lipid IV(A) 3-deoxy-D-manno-octulosonic acid transferase n=1 Tax=Thalassotalea sp. G2M2-11 TaxID=2787627 RepID=UPI0019CFA007
MHHTFALFCYRLVLLLLLPIVLLLLVARSKNHPEYRQRLNERLGWLKTPFSPNGIVIHAASVGEVIALKAYIEKILQTQPELPVTVTTFTPTGSAQVNKLFANRVQHCYLPLDIWPCTWLFLNALKPKALVLMETELWPNLIAQCQARNIGLQLINGRLSDHSMKSYRKLNWLITPCLQRFDKILTQSDDNRENFLRLGALPERCLVSGNLKYDIQLSDEVIAKAQALKNMVPETRKVWLVASTHPGDEELVLSSFKALKQQHEALLLVLVPRHPERFTQVYEYSVEQGFNTIKRSEKLTVENHHDIWLIDTLGELLALCDLADIVAMGGSFSTIGGHNPLEPALFKKAIVVGHDMSNFKQVMAQLISAGGIKQLSTTSRSSFAQVVEQLTLEVNDLLADHQARLTLGQHAYQVVQANQGASELSAQALRSLLATKQ